MAVWQSKVDFTNTLFDRYLELLLLIALFTTHDLVFVYTYNLHVVIVRFFLQSGNSVSENLVLTQLYVIFHDISDGEI